MEEKIYYIEDIYAYTYIFYTCMYILTLIISIPIMLSAHENLSQTMYEITVIRNPESKETIKKIVK